MGANDGRRTPLMNLGVQVSMRVLAIGTALASMGLTITNHEVASVYGINFEAKYDYSSAFRYTILLILSRCTYTYLISELKKDRRIINLRPMEFHRSTLKYVWKIINSHTLVGNFAKMEKY